MKKIFFIAFAFIAAGLVYSFFPAGDEKPVETPAPIAKPVSHSGGPIHWMSWEEAVKANEKTQKKIFIDFYTDWCGWCKRMDKTTFSDPKVAEYINENFHPVKFDAEQKGDIVFQGTTFKYRQGGRRGVHMLAYELLNGRLGYPSYVYLTPDYERILISPGYKQVPDMKKELKFVAEDHYTSTSWDEFKKTGE